MNKLLVQAKYWRFDENSIFPFGKYEGKTILQVFKDDPSYIGFCIQNMPKFVLTVKAWNIFYALNKSYFDEIDKAYVLVALINRQTECGRILRENTHLCNEKEWPASYFRNYITFLDGATCVVKTTIKKLNKIILDDHGEKLHVSQIYRKLDFSESELSQKENNRIKFKIDIIDLKDLVFFKKYDTSYAESGVKIFEIVRHEPCGLVCLVVKIDWKNLRTETLPFGSEPVVRILPDNADCALFVINSYMTQDEVVGERDMNQEEINLEASTKKARQEKQQELADKRKEDGLSRNWLDSFEEEEEEEEEEEGTSLRKVPTYGPVNKIDKIVSIYSLNRQAFPQANLFQTTSLQYYKHQLQFSVHADVVNDLVRQWYESKGQLKIYELRSEMVRRNHMNYIRSQNTEDDEPHHDCESWEELTDS